jgi:septum formation protein
MFKRQLILASQSPRRQQLLSQLGYQFQTHSADIDESVLPEESALHYVARMAEQKAQTIAQHYQQQPLLVLGADTAVVIDGQILGKPVDFADAKRMLSLLSANKHQVFTSIHLMDCLQPQQSATQVVVSDVFFKALSSDEIAAYWQTGEPCDKAGAYAIQGLAGKFIIRIEGSYSAIVGLPLYETDQLLSRYEM